MSTNTEKAMVTKEDKASTSMQKSPDKTIKEWIAGDQFKQAVQQALPSHLTAERFIRVALTALIKTPKLAKCTKNSIFKAILDCSQLGLEPDGRRAHLIPYENRKAGTVEAQLIIDYKGLIELAKRSGEVRCWKAMLVCENDDFAWNNGMVTHKVDWFKPRGKTLAVYSYVQTKDGIEDYEVMTLDEVNAIRKRSKAASNGPWVTDFDEMAKKTAIRRHSKRLTLSPEFHDAVTHDFDKSEEVIENVDFDVEYDPKEIVQGNDKEVEQEEQLAQEPEPQIPEDKFTKPEEEQTIDTSQIHLTSKEINTIQSQIIKFQRKAESFNEFLKKELGIDTLKQAKRYQIEQILQWITQD